MKHQNLLLLSSIALLLGAAAPFVHADPPGQTYFDVTEHVPWGLKPPVYGSNDVHHKFGAVFWRGKIVLVNGEASFQGGAAFLRLSMLDGTVLTPRDNKSVVEFRNMDKLDQGKVRNGPEYGLVRTDPLIQAQVFDDKLYVFYYDRNNIKYNVYTPPGPQELSGGTWSNRITLPGTGLVEAISGRVNVDDFAVTEIVQTDADGNGTPKMVMAISFNQDPTAGTGPDARRVIRFFQTADGTNWTQSTQLDIDQADAKGKFKLRAIDIDLKTVVDETGKMIAALAAVVRADDSSVNDDSKALVGLYDGETIKNVTNIRDQFDDKSVMPFKMRLYWGTIANSEASFNGEPLSKARNVLQVFWIGHSVRGGSQAIHRAEIFLGEPGYRAANRPLTLLKLRGRPRGQSVYRESTFVAIPSMKYPDQHVIPSLYQTDYVRFGTGFGVTPQTLSYDSWEGSFDVLPIVQEVRDPGTETSRYQQYALVLGYNGLLNRAVYLYASYTALAFKSDQLVPYGYVRDSNGNSQEVKYRTSTTIASQAATDYRSWQLVGIITGPPPYTNELQQAGLTNTPVTSRVDFTQTAASVLQTTAEVSSTTSLSAGFQVKAVKLDTSWKQTAFRSDAEKQTFTTSYSNSIVASPAISQSRGRMIFLVPTVRVQSLFQSGWDGEKINYRHVFGSEEPTPITFLTTSVTSMDLKGVDYDMTNPNAEDTPFAKGSMAFPASNNLQQWALQSDWNYSGTDRSYIRDKATDLNALFTQYTNEAATVKLESQSNAVVKTSSTVEIDAKIGLFGKLNIGRNGKNVHAIETTTTNTYSLTISQTAPAVNVPAGPPTYARSWSVKPYFVRPALIPQTDRKYQTPAYIPEAYRDKNQAPFLLTYRVSDIAYNSSPARSVSTRATRAVAPDAEAFTEVPQSTEAGPGQSVTLKGEYGSGAPVSYQWYHNFEPILGEQGTTLSLPNLTIDQEGYYYLAATDSTGETHLSTGAYVDITNAPKISLQPSSDEAPTYTSQTFVVNATDATSYQWRVNGEDVEGATSDTFVFNTRPEQIGTPQIIDVVVSNLAGSITSDPAILTVFAPVDVNDAPIDSSVTEGSAAAFSVSGTTGTSFHYYWYVADKLVGETTTPTFRVSDVPASWHGQTLSVAAVNEFGDWDTADVALISVIADDSTPTVDEVSPHVTLRKAKNDGKQVYVARAQKVPGITYQWYLGKKKLSNRMNGVAGATGARIRLKGGKEAWNGVLKVRITDQDGRQRTLVARRLKK